MKLIKEYFLQKLISVTFGGMVRESTHYSENGKEKEAFNVLFFFRVPQDKQVADKGRFLFIEVLQIEEVTEVEEQQLTNLSSNKRWRLYREARTVLSPQRQSAEPRL